MAMRSCAVALLTLMLCNAPDDAFLMYNDFREFQFFGVLEFAFEHSMVWGRVSMASLHIL